MDNLIARATALMAANAFIMVQFVDAWLHGKLKGHGPVFATGIIMTTLAIGSAYTMLLHTRKDILSWWLEKLPQANLIAIMLAFAWQVFSG